MRTPHRAGPGRPHKYGRPSRAVTLSLPEDVIDRLATIGGNDLGRGIVALAERHAPSPAARGPAEIESYGKRAVIVVTPVRALRRLSGVQLVPIGGGRALISLDHPHLLPELELNIRDAIERSAAGAERKALEAIAAILRRAREAHSITLEERTIIVLQSKRRRRAS